MVFSCVLPLRNGVSAQNYWTWQVSGVVDTVWACVSLVCPLFAHQSTTLFLARLVQTWVSLIGCSSSHDGKDVIAAPFSAVRTLHQTTSKPLFFTSSRCSSMVKAIQRGRLIQIVCPDNLWACRSNGLKSTDHVHPSIHLGNFLAILFGSPSAHTSLCCITHG